MIRVHIGSYDACIKYADDEVGVWIVAQDMAPGGYDYDPGSQFLSGTYKDVLHHVKQNRLGDYIEKVPVTAI